MHRLLRVRWVLGLIAPLVVAELALRVLAPSLPSPEPWPSVGLEVKSDYAERLVGEDVDVLILGSSVSEAGIDPDLLLDRHGISAFNAAGPFSTPIGMQRWLDHSLWPLDPDTMLIGLSIWGAPEGRADDVLANGLDTVAAHAQEADNWFLGRSDFWARRSQLRNPFDLLNDSVNASAYTPRGHNTYYEGQTRASEATTDDGAPFPGFSKDNETALGDIIAAAGEQGIRVVLLLEPGGCPSVLPDCANADSEDRALEAVEDLARRYDVALINGRAIETPDHWYADSAHFNEIGAAAFTEFVATELGSL